MFTIHPHIIVHLLLWASIGSYTRRYGSCVFLCVHSWDALVYKGHISNIGINTIEYTCIETSLFMWAILYPYRTSLYPVLFYASSRSEPQKSKSCRYQYKSSSSFVTYVNFSTRKKGYKKIFNPDWEVLTRKNPLGI